MGIRGRKVYLRSRCVPSIAWVVHGIEKMASRDQITDVPKTEVAQGFASRAFMTADPPSRRFVRLLRILGRIPPTDRRHCRREGSPRGKGMVVVSDTFFPVGRPEMDGQSADIHEVNGAMRGVVVPRGEHTVTMRYRPVSVYLGALFTLIGIAAVVGIRFVKNRG